ncbi:MAG: hypothetical protein KDD44_13815, partial [Bdellovibrionales bacterium]|nr:hypothetical protein [Bdellovibrionales bacterium]
LLRISPHPTRCFQVQEINPDDQVLFPPDDIRPEQLGSVRYVYWNKRIACTCPYRGVKSPKEDSGNSKGWGCQVWPRSNPALGNGDFEKGHLKSHKGADPHSWPSWAQSAKQLYPFEYSSWP